ncbi:MAG: hypothetical protein WA160_08695 [Pseudobdellovibrio sp.]
MLFFSHQAWSRATLIAPHVDESIIYQRTCNDYKNNSCQKIPSFLKTQKELCEMTRKLNKCDKFEKEKSDQSWKYIQCDYNMLCFQNNVEVKDTAAACLVGATAMAIDLVKLAKLIYEGAAERILKKREWIAECDKSIDCKRKLALGQPTTSLLANPDKEEDLKKYTAAYLYSKKLEYDPERVRLMIQGSITKEQYFKEIGWKPPTQSKLDKMPPEKVLSLLAIWESIKSKVDSEVSEVGCYIPAEKTRLKCQVLSDVLSGVGLEKAITSAMVTSGKRLLKESAQAIEHRVSNHLVHIAESSAPKRALIKEFAQKNVVSKAENEEWKQFISNPNASQKNLTIENSKLKSLNDDVFKDEEYVTALMNAYGEIQMRKIKLLEAEIKKVNPEFEFKTFSDFKSVRVAYDDIPGFKINGKTIDQLLKDSTEQANIFFADFTLKHQLVRESDKPATWYKAAQDSTDDWVGLKAKYTRENTANTSMFLTPQKEKEFKSWAQDEFLAGKSLRSEVMDIFKDTAVVTSKDVREANINTGVFGILRKNKDNPLLAKSLIEEKYGLQSLSDQNFGKLQDYFKKSDIVSPGLRSTERGFATLADAPHGGISVDMIDLGAEHIQATSSFAFGKSKNIDEFLKVSRQAEEELTEKILQRKNEIEKKFRDITGDQNAKVICSGDGCKAFLPGRELTDSETKQFADAVTQGGEQGKLRFSAIQNLKSNEYADIVAKQGEDLEKSLRKSLRGKIDPKRLDGLNFTIRIKATEPGHGTAQLHISEAQGFKLSKSEKKQIEEFYQKALKESDMGYK